MRVGLVPLDERPANTRYPRMVAAIAGVQVVAPPSEYLSAFRKPAPVHELRAWLLEEVSRLDALVVSLDMLCHGGLIASRTTSEPATSILPRLQTLRVLRRGRPDLKIHAFNAVTRIPDADDATEEPSYWADHGREIHRLSRLEDQRVRGGRDVTRELKALYGRLPTGVVRDFISRRLRNHTVNLASLELAADGVLDTLTICSDDTAPWGLGAGEQRWIGGWAERLGLGGRVLRYPGADEIGCTLVARAINDAVGRAPRVRVRYCPSYGREVVAPYEDVPLSQTVDRQVSAIGAEPVEADPDLHLVVNPPTSEDLAYAPPPPDGPPPTQLVDDVEGALRRGRPVAVADVAYANGGDARLVGMLGERGVLPDLAAYAGWNTAGNTIGTALAQGSVAIKHRDGAAGRDAQERFLLHRILEDWGYQATVRWPLRRRLEQETGIPEPTGETLPETCAHVERQLSALIRALPGFAGRFEILPGSTRLPWGRTFECDFDLRRVDRPGGQAT